MKSLGERRGKRFGRFLTNFIVEPEPGATFNDAPKVHNAFLVNIYNE